MRFKQYYQLVQEYAAPRRSTEIGLEACVDLYRTHCTQFKAEYNQIYRGVYGETMGYMHVNPALSTRLSRNTTSFTMWLMESSPAWKRYPKRSKSIICSSSSSYPSSFGQVFRVIPYDDSAIGVCSGMDFFESFTEVDTTGYGSVPEYNSFVAEVITSISSQIDDLSSSFSHHSSVKGSAYLERGYGYEGDEDNIHNSAEAFLTHLDQLAQHIENSGQVMIDKVDEMISTRHKHLWQKLKASLSQGVPLTTALAAPLAPDKNNFKLISSDKFVSTEVARSGGYGVEVWTEGPALLVLWSKEDAFFNMINRSL